MGYLFYPIPWDSNEIIVIPRTLYQHVHVYSSLYSTAD